MKWFFIVVSPILVPLALLLLLWQLPAIAFGWITLRFAVKAGNALVPVTYGVVLAAVILTSLSWPFLVIYALPL